MASSRVEKIGTIFSRTAGLLKAGAMKNSEKPIWFDVYAAFPPHSEPRYDRPAPNIKVRNIFYEEDQARAKYHKLNKMLLPINLSDTKQQTQTQHFIESYRNLKEQGALDEEKIIEVAVDMTNESYVKQRSDLFANSNDSGIQDVGLVKSFSDAQVQNKDKSSENTTSPPVNLDLTNIFKD